jgi:micrococcal nuclease
VGSNTIRGLVGALALVLAASAACRSASTDASRQGTAEATIERVVDGDTVVLQDSTRVRLIGIDTPETVDPRRPVECFGAEASAHAKALLPEGTRVRLEYDVDRIDRYGRTLAYVFRVEDGLFVNLALARDGYAEQLTVPPNVAHVDDIRRAVDEARAARRGLWGDAACATP